MQISGLAETVNARSEVLHCLAFGPESYRGDRIRNRELAARNARNVMSKYEAFNEPPLPSSLAYPRPQCDETKPRCVSCLTADLQC